MKNKCYITLLFVALSFTACKDNANESMEGDVNASINEALGSKKNNWTGKLDELLTQEMAAQALGYTAADAKKEYRQIFENPDTHDLSYSWEMGREKEMEIPYAGKMMFPTDDRIELRWVKSTTLEDFKNSYRTPTAEELKNAEKAMQERTAQLQKEGKLTPEQAKMATNLGSSLGSDVSYDEVKNVGEYAVWNNKDKNLSVFYKGIQFQLFVDVGDEVTNTSKAIALAQKIIKEKL